LREYYRNFYKKPHLNNSDLILFYGSTCPHCKIVEEYISKNQIDQKLKISQVEVYDNKSNANTFSNMVKEICPNESDWIGGPKPSLDGANPTIYQGGNLPVPFLVDQKDKKCIVGDTPITDYLSEKTK